MIKISKQEKYFFIFLGIFVLTLYLFSEYRDQNLEKDGVFILGTIISKSYMKNGQSYTVSYSFKGQNKELGFSGLGLKLIEKDLISIRISTKTPFLKNALDYVDRKVPSCYKLSDVPPEGWKEIPIDTCK